MMRLDTLIFALLAGYVFFRLWRILGVRVEGGQTSFSPDEVVILHNATPSQMDEDSLTPMVKELQKYEPNFDPEHFVQIAERMLVKIVQAFASHDAAVLRQFVSPPLCEAFESKMLERQTASQQRHVEVIAVQGHITAIETPDASTQHSTPARIFITFKSEQIIYTTEADGSSYDNPSHLPTRLSDDWVFARMIGSDSPIWYVENTSSQKLS